MELALCIQGKNGFNVIFIIHLPFVSDLYRRPFWARADEALALS